MNTWDRNPQDPSDEHDWVRWFDDLRKYRDTVWHYKLQSWVPSTKVRGNP